MTNQRPRIDYTSSDYESLRTAMLSIAQERLPEWTDHSPNDLGVALVELFAWMGDSLFYHLDRVANESYLETAQERRSVVNLLRVIGYELRPPLPAYAELTLLFEVNDDTPAQVQIPPGTTFRTNAKATGSVIGFVYLRQSLTIEPFTLPEVVQDGVTYRLFRPLPVTQVDQTIASTVLGSSDGSPRQRFRLPVRPLIDGTLQVTVLQPFQKVWTQKDTLLHSGGGDEHYAVRRDENDYAWIEFGDGTRGKPPVRGRNNLWVTYSVGGGARGNVKARTIVEVSPSITGLTRVYNEADANRGSDRESIAEAVLRAPRQFRAMGRAVTASDYEAHARAFGAAKARARGFGNRIELLIAPTGGGYPSDQMKDDLRVYLDSKRILTSFIDVRDPVYVPIHIAVTVEVEPLYFQSEVRSRIKAAVRDLWSFDRAEFGETLYVSKIYEAIEALDGVAGVTVNHFSIAGKSNVVSGAIALGYAELPFSVGLATSEQLVITGGKV